MDPIKLPGEITKVDYDTFLKAFQESASKPQEKFIQMTDDLLCQHQSRKAFLTSAVNLENYTDLPADLVKKYSRKVQNSGYLTEIVDDALESTKEKEHIELIEMYYFQHLSKQEIAEKLYCDVATVYRWQKTLLLQVAIHIFGADAVGLEAI